MLFIRYLLVVVFISITLGTSFAQQKKLIHKPRTAVIIPGLRREFSAELAKISIEANPGWQAEEVIDSSEHIYQLLFTDLEDSSKRMLSLLMYPSNLPTFDSAVWSNLKKSVRESYGNRGIAIRPLDEHLTSKSKQDSSGVIASYEILAKHTDFIEYIDAIVTKNSLVLLTVPIKPEKYQRVINYFRDIAQSIKIGR